MPEKKINEPVKYRLLPNTKILIGKKNYFRLPGIKTGLNDQKPQVAAQHFTAIEKVQNNDCVTIIGPQKAIINSIYTTNYSGPIFYISMSNSTNSLCLLPNQRILIPRRVRSLSDSGAWSSVPPNHFQQARHLRKIMTRPERLLWQYLRVERLGIKFRSQHPIGPFITDFYARQAGLVVEVDGDQFHTSPDQQQYDQMRDEWMESLGLRVRRYPASEIFSNINSVVEDIQYWGRECVLKTSPNYQWCYLENLKPGNRIISGPDFKPYSIESIQLMNLECTIHNLETDAPPGLITDQCILG